MEVEVPWRDGEVDHAAAEAVVCRQPYWKFVAEKVACLADAPGRVPAE